MERSRDRRKMHASGIVHKYNLSIRGNFLMRIHEIFIYLEKSSKQTLIKANKLHFLMIENFLN